MVKNYSDPAKDWRKAGTLMTAHSPKTAKGELMGYLTGICYLMPHTMADKKTVCPYSTPACRVACLYHSGVGDLPRAAHARLTRTLLWHDEPDMFVDTLALEVIQLRHLAIKHDMKLAIRLNGTSDIIWEKHELENGQTIFEFFEGVQFYDYTKIPLHLRRPPANYHLTYSLAEEPLDQAIAYLRAGQSVSVVVPEEEKLEDGSWFALGDKEINVVDGDHHDLRFLDPPGSLVMLRPKGRTITTPEGAPMVRRGLVKDLIREAKKPA